MTIKNIAFIHPEFPCGGAEKITTHISQALTQRGYRCYLFVKQLNKEQLTPEDSNIHYLQLPGKTIYTEDSADYVIQQIQELEIGLFICPHLYLSYLNRIRKETSCKVLYANHSMPFWEAVSKLTLGAHLAKQSIGKWIEWYLFRAPKYHLPNYLINKVKYKYKGMYDACDVYSVLCQAYGRKIEETLKINQEDSKILVLTNPIIPLKEMPNLQKKKQVVYVGRFTFGDKRIDRVLHIWKKLFDKYPDWELLIYGDGEEKANLHALSRQLKLERIRFMGYCSDTSTIYQQASILCLTSTIEGWPLVLTEAQQYGVYPVAFDCVAGIHQILSPSGVNGFLVPPFNLDAYAKQLEQIMCDYHDRPDLRQKMMQSVDQYSLDQIIEQWLAMIAHLEVSD